MDDKSPQDRTSRAPNKIRRPRKKTNAKRVRSARASAFARAADVVAGVAKPPPQVGARKPPPSVVAPADAGPAPPAPALSVEDPAGAPQGVLFASAAPEHPRRVWPWALGAVLLALCIGFALGALVLDRHIRRKYGGLRIY